MLMFYNMGKFSADPDARAIFDADERREVPRADRRVPAAARRRAADLVVGRCTSATTASSDLLQSTDPDELAGARLPARATATGFVATRTAFLHGALLREGDVLKVEVTGPAEALAAADMIAPHLPPVESPRTVTLFDLSERNLTRHGTELARSGLSRGSLASRCALARARRRTPRRVRLLRAARSESMTFSIRAMTRRRRLGRVYFDPFSCRASAAPCRDCAPKAMLDDWHGYLKDVGRRGRLEEGAVRRDAGEQPRPRQVAGKATAPEGLRRRARCGTAGERRPRVAFVRSLARSSRRAVFVDRRRHDDSARRRGDAPRRRDRPRMKAARDPFLAQRYAFQVLRIMFYQRDWRGRGRVLRQERGGARRAVEGSGVARALLPRRRARAPGKPRAREPRARAHPRELPAARGRSPPRTSSPMEDSRLAASRSKLAKTRAREDRAVAARRRARPTALVAMQEIMKLDPKSDLLALLARARARARRAASARRYGGENAGCEGRAAREEGVRDGREDRATDRPDAGRRSAVDRRARRSATSRRSAAISRRRARTSTSAVQLRPNDARVASQAKASLALALARLEGSTPRTRTSSRRDERARPRRSRKLARCASDVRGRLAKAYAKEGRLVDAELARHRARPTRRRSGATWRSSSR